ncbi:hypothetical protein [Nostoc sp.]
MQPFQDSTPWILGDRSQNRIKKRYLVAQLLILLAWLLVLADGVMLVY